MPGLSWEVVLEVRRYPPVSAHRRFLLSRREGPDGWKQTQHKQQQAIKPHICALRRHTARGTKTRGGAFWCPCFSVSSPRCLSPFLSSSFPRDIFREHSMYMTEVGVHRRWITAQAISVEAERQKQSWAAECIQPDAVGPTDVQGGGGEVIEMSHSLDKKTLNWSLKFQCGRCACF